MGVSYLAWAMSDGVRNNCCGIGQFGTTEGQTWGTHAAIAHPDHFLAEFNELHEFGDSIEAQERRELKQRMFGE